MTRVHENFYLLDSSIYIFQSHFSPHIDCYDVDGNQLSAVYGFCQFLMQFLRRVKPRYLAAAHDESLFVGFRHRLCDNYKSNRELPDDNLEMQLNACVQICEVLGIPSFASREYEADDIIGTMARRIRSFHDTANVHIVSKDKDLAQLLTGEGDCLWDMSANRRRYRDDVMEQYGILPEQIPDFLALVGDAVDCISGVPGIGPVKAKLLLQCFESLEGVYQNLDQVPALDLRGAARIRELLDQHRDKADLSKLLATIVCDVDEPDEDFSQVAPQQLEVKLPDLRAMGDFLRDHRFAETETRQLLAFCEKLAAQG